MARPTSGAEGPGGDVAIAGERVGLWGRVWDRLRRVGVGRAERLALARLARALAGTRLEAPAARARRLTGLARAVRRARDEAEALGLSVQRARAQLEGPPTGTGFGGGGGGSPLDGVLEQARREQGEAQRALDLIEALLLAARHGRLEEACHGLRPVQTEVRRALLGAAFEQACAVEGLGLEQDAAWLEVPGGTYTVGHASGRGRGDGPGDEGPPARVELSTFWIARRALDPAAVAAALAAGDRPGEGAFCPDRPPADSGPTGEADALARRGTTWSEAVCVAERLGAELPSEVEWEVAQRLHGDALWPAGARRAREWCRDPFDPALYARLAAGLGPQAFGPWALRAARGGPLGPWRLTRRAGLDPSARHPDTQVRLVRRAAGARPTTQATEEVT